MAIETPADSLWDKISGTTAALWSSIIRTVVPVVVGVVVGFFVQLGIPLDDSAKATVTAIVTGLAAIIYYVLVRLLERSFAWASHLLGSSKTPVGYASNQSVASGHVTVAPASLVVTEKAKQ